MHHDPPDVVGAVVVGGPVVVGGGEPVGFTIGVVPGVVGLTMGTFPGVVSLWMVGWRGEKSIWLSWIASEGFCAAPAKLTKQ